MSPKETRQERLANIARSNIHVTSLKYLRDHVLQSIMT